MPFTPHADQAARRAAYLAEREALTFARDCRPEEIAYQERNIAWMRQCTGTGPRCAVGAEMDGRQFSAGEIAAAEEYLAKCKAAAAELDTLVAAVELAA